MSQLVNYAERELRLAGLFDEDSDYGGMLGEAVMELVKVFADQGHSGFSATLALNIFNEVARRKPLTPLTGEPEEWNEIEKGFFQNKRCPTVFKRDGIAYNSEGIIFRDREGLCFTSRDSRVAITFPYVPESKYVDVEEG